MFPIKYKYPKQSLCMPRCPNANHTYTVPSGNEINLHGSDLFIRSMVFGTSVEASYIYNAHNSKWH